MGGGGALVLVAFGTLMIPLATFGADLPDFEPPLFTSTRLVHLLIQLTYVGVGGLLAWRFLAGDRAARRIQDGGLEWIVRVLATVVPGGTDLFFLRALLIRGGAWWLHRVREPEAGRRPGGSSAGPFGHRRDRPSPSAAWLVSWAEERSGTARAWSGGAR